MRNSFVIYRSYFEAIENLNDADKGVLFAAICRYGLDGVEPDFDGYFKMFWVMLKPTLDKSMKRYETSVENGSKGGRPKKTKTQSKPKNNITKTQPEPNQNLNDNDNDNYNVNDKSSIPTLSGSERLRADCLDFYNNHKTEFPQYTPEFYKEFIEYWGQTIVQGKGKGKCLYENEKTWDLKRRLKTSYERVWKQRKSDNGADLDADGLPKYKLNDSSRIAAHFKRHLETIGSDATK